MRNNRAVTTAGIADAPPRSGRVLGMLQLCIRIVVVIAVTVAVVA